MTRRRLLIATAVSLTLAGCGSNTTPTVQTITVTAPQSAPTAAGASQRAAGGAFKVGDAAKSGGAVIIVHSANETDTVSRLQSNRNGDFGPFHPPHEGATFVVVNTTVLNDGKKSMDLTCSYPIETHLETASGRRYDTVEAQYKLEGNPDCNANLQPGFTAEMTYLYEIPSIETPACFLFRDTETVEYGTFSSVAVIK